MATSLLSSPAAAHSAATILRRRAAAEASALFFASSPLSGTPLRRTRISREASSRHRARGRRHPPCVPMAHVDFLGDFGARDPYSEELESNFAENVVGNADTEHKILIPNISTLALAQWTLEPVPHTQPPMSRMDAEKLLKKIVGWRLVEEKGAMRLQCLWKLRDYECGIKLINRIYRAVESAGHYPSLCLEQPNQLTAELWTHSIGGLSENDFIMAAKIDEIKTLDLLPKKRIWA